MYIIVYILVITVGLALLLMLVVGLRALWKRCCTRKISRTRLQEIRTDEVEMTLMTGCPNDETLLTVNTSSTTSHHDTYLKSIQRRRQRLIILRDTRLTDAQYAPGENMKAFSIAQAERLESEIVALDEYLERLTMNTTQSEVATPIKKQHTKGSNSQAVVHKPNKEAHVSINMEAEIELVSLPAPVMPNGQAQAVVDKASKKAHVSVNMETELVSLPAPVMPNGQTQAVVGKPSKEVHVSVNMDSAPGLVSLPVPMMPTGQAMATVPIDHGAVPQECTTVGAYQDQMIKAYQMLSVGMQPSVIVQWGINPVVIQHLMASAGLLDDTDGTPTQMPAASSPRDRTEHLNTSQVAGTSKCAINEETVKAASQRETLNVAVVPKNVEGIPPLDLSSIAPPSQDNKNDVASPIQNSHVSVALDESLDCDAAVEQGDENASYEGSSEEEESDESASEEEEEEHFGEEEDNEEHNHGGQNYGDLNDGGENCGVEKYADERHGEEEDSEEECEEESEEESEEDYEEDEDEDVSDVSTDTDASFSGEYVVNA